MGVVYASSDRHVLFLFTNIAGSARLLGIGHGGQVLLSEVVRDLTQDTLPPSFALRSLGEQHLRELARPEPVFPLLPPPLIFDFPPLKSLNSPELPNNLPRQVTSFIGRRIVPRRASSWRRG